MINNNDNDYKSMDRSADHTYEVGPATPAKSLTFDWLIGRKALVGKRAFQGAVN
jgi:hypothetical protein